MIDSEWDRLKDGIAMCLELHHLLRGEERGGEGRRGDGRRGEEQHGGDQWVTWSNAAALQLLALRGAQRAFLSVSVRLSH